MPKVPVVTTKLKFIIDFSKPASDNVFDGADFEKFLHDRIKVNGKAGQLEDHIKVVRDGNLKVTIQSNIPFSKRYLKYLTKKFLKKSNLRDYIRVVASAKDIYQLRYYNISGTGDEDED